ncbi:uncharacterized protein CLUP02_12334 [Colletotrichum lupini]|uniref:Uncharacterized protein n=1 Tax=Colletotrichum lupini TaxID=145971 RepID=A0A9Q8T0D4_9PEZI|nr:uncharacterized protein CLUP02_12334 [Colletotrichum lupini]UQC86832.1 hypothetical protein CLUP02_12334 [Colletotrichum lupini]
MTAAVDRLAASRPMLLGRTLKGRSFHRPRYEIEKRRLGRTDVVPSGTAMKFLFSEPEKSKRWVEQAFDVNAAVRRGASSNGVPEVFDDERPFMAITIAVKAGPVSIDLRSVRVLIDLGLQASMESRSGPPVEDQHVHISTTFMVLTGSFRDGIGTSAVSPHCRRAYNTLINPMLAATRTTMVLLRSCADDDYVADDGEDCRSIFTTNKELERRIGYGESDLFRSPTLRAEPKSSLADTLAIISRQRDISTQARLIGPLPQVQQGILARLKTKMASAGQPPKHTRSIAKVRRSQHSTRARSIGSGRLHSQLPVGPQPLWVAEVTITQSGTMLNHDVNGPQAPRCTLDNCNLPIAHLHRRKGQAGQAIAGEGVREGDFQRDLCKTTYDEEASWSWFQTNRHLVVKKRLSTSWDAECQPTDLYRRLWTLKMLEDADFDTVQSDIHMRG